jgi:hypothetical protein
MLAIKLKKLILSFNFAEGVLYLLHINSNKLSRNTQLIKSISIYEANSRRLYAAPQY